MTEKNEDEIPFADIEDLALRVKENKCRSYVWAAEEFAKFILQRRQLPGIHTGHFCGSCGLKVRKEPSLSSIKKEGCTNVYCDDYPVREIIVSLERIEKGIVLPGWECPFCAAFNGSAKEVLTKCRACGATKPL